MSPKAKTIAAGAAVTGIGAVIARRLAPRAHAACQARCAQKCGHSPSNAAGEGVQHA